LSFDEQVLVQRYILEMFSKVGVTSIWTKDGDLDITRIYEQILRHDSLPVRAVLDNMYTFYSEMSDFAAYKKRADEIKNSGLPPGFLRADGAKIFIDLPIQGWNWFFEPYADDPSNCGRPAFPLEDFRAQLLEADRQGLQINISVYGDRAAHESLEFLAEAARINPPRPRRHSLEHAQYLIDRDLARFKKQDVMVSLNPIVGYPDREFQEHLLKTVGAKRLDTIFQRYRDLIAAGATVVNGSDFPIAPFDPLIGIHILATGADLNGQPTGGLWPKQRLSVEEALRTYTTYPAYASFTEDHRGRLLPGFDADLVMLSDNILDPNFDKLKLARVKTVLTAINGHIVHEDFTTADKVIGFGQE
ncbi:MAG: amidohydrolase family protein, partial [Candidatus Aureabacteria bacterium]|nr:amidohydrolase family protein [Candidatus Auribacterota bacterium]